MGADMAECGNGGEGLEAASILSVGERRERLQGVKGLGAWSGAWGEKTGVRSAEQPLWRSPSAISNFLLQRWEPRSSVKKVNERA